MKTKYDSLFHSLRNWGQLPGRPSITWRKMTVKMAKFE